MLLGMRKYAIMATLTFVSDHTMLGQSDILACFIGECRSVSHFSGGVGSRQAVSGLAAKSLGGALDRSCLVPHSK